MIKVIYKLSLPSRINKVQLPADAKVIHVHIQKSVPTIWYETLVANLDAPKQWRDFEVRGTGLRWEDPPGLESVYLGTVHCEDLVWHVYEVIKKAPRFFQEVSHPLERGTDVNF